MPSFLDLLLGGFSDPEAQTQGRLMMGDPQVPSQPQAAPTSLYGALAPRVTGANMPTGNDALGTALMPFSPVPTAAGTTSPKGWAALPGSAQPSFQQGAGLQTYPGAVLDASNSVGDAQAAGLPSFLGLPEQNAKRPLLSNSPGDLTIGQGPQGFASLKPTSAPAPASAVPSDDDAEDKPAPNAAPAGPAPVAAPIASGLAAGKDLASASGLPAAGGASSSDDLLSTVKSKLKNLYGNGGPGDALVALGIGMMSGPGGTQRALSTIQQGVQLQQAQKLQQQQLAMDLQKLQQARDAQTGGAAYVKSIYAKQGTTLTDQQANAIAANSGAMSSLVSGDTKDKNDAVTTVTDPQERASLGLSPTDTRIVQKDANGKITMPGAGGVQVNLGDKANGGLDGKIVDTLDEGRKNATAAVGTLQNINHMGQLLDSGQLITGAGANQVKDIRNALSTALGIDDPGVTKTQEFISAANSKASSIARSISGAGHTTNADLDMAKIISGADPTYSAGALRQILQWQQQAATQQIQHHNADVDNFSKIQPDAAARAGFFKVGMPDTYDLSGAQQPAAGTTPSRLRYNPATGNLE